MAIPIDFTTGLFLADTTNAAGSILLPLTTGIQGRTITIKDVAGACGTNALTITTTNPDVFEHGGTTLTMNRNYGFLTLTAGTNTWYTINATSISSIQTDSLFVRDKDLTTTYYDVQISSGYLLANGNYISTSYNKELPPQLSTTTFTASTIYASNVTVRDTLYVDGTLSVYNFSTIPNPTFTMFQLYDNGGNYYRDVTISSGVLFFDNTVAITGTLVVAPSTITTSSFVVSSLVVDHISAPYMFATEQVSFPSQTPFSPSSIANLVSWFDAKDSDYIGYDITNNVSTVLDKSQTQAHFQQPTGANQPSYSLSNYIQFAGNQFLCNTQPTTYNNSRNCSIFLVTEASQMNLASPLTGIPQSGNDYQAGDGFVLQLGNSTTSNITYVSQFPGNYYAPGSLSFYNTPRNSLTKAMYNFTFDTTPMGYLYSNGTFFEKHLMSNNGTAPRGFVVGARAANNAPDLGATLYGKIYEILYFNRFLPTQERQTIEGYLAWKWNLQINLPLQHPYRFVSP